MNKKQKQKQKREKTKMKTQKTQKTEEWIQSKVDNIIASDPDAKVEYNIYGTCCKVTSKGWVHAFDDSTDERIIEVPYKQDEQDKKDENIVACITLESTPRSTAEIEREELLSAEAREVERKIRVRAHNLKEGQKIAQLLGFELSDYCKIDLGGSIECFLEEYNDEDTTCYFGPLLARLGSGDNKYQRIYEITVERKAYSKYITFTHYTDVKEFTTKITTSSDLHSVFFDFLLDEEY